MADLLALTSGDAQATVSPRAGGSIASFRWRGVDVLRPTSPDALAAADALGFACYPLLPYSNRIANARLRVGGVVHELRRNLGDHPHSIHGVGWQRAWQPIAQDGRHAALECVHEPEGDAGRAWPFAFRARQSFALVASGHEATLTVRIAIANEDARPFPFGLGFHPFLPKRAAARLDFRARGVWQTDSTRLPTTCTDLPDAWRFEGGRDVDVMELDNVFTGWDGHARVEWPAERLALTIAADRALAYLVVFARPEQRYVAVEPVSHMTDAFNRAAAGESGTGARTLPPGQSFSCTMRLNVASLSP